MSRQPKKTDTQPNIDMIKQHYPPCMHNLAMLLREHLNKKSQVYNALDEIRTELLKTKEKLESAIEVGERLSKEKKEMSKKVDQLTEQKDTALSRVSQLAGNKLMDRNSAITDLSDPNRPMRLGERFSEIYDNEWTDAFVKLTEVHEDEKARVQILLNTAQECHEECEKHAKEQWDHFAKGLSLNMGQTKATATDGLPAHMSKPLSEFRKKIAVDSLPFIEEKVFENMKSKADSTKIKEYIRACVHGFWLACVQDPPLYFDFKDHALEEINVTTHRPYTINGKVVDYLVWPTVYIEKGGSILMKGVLQCKKDKIAADDDNSEKVSNTPPTTAATVASGSQQETIGDSSSSRQAKPKDSPVTKDTSKK